MKVTYFLPTLLTLAAGALALPSPANADKPDCAVAQKLATGIDENIAVQKQEKKDLAAVKKIVSAATIDKDDFATAKSQLLSTINKGVTIRQDNQKIAPAGNKAIAGLKTVQSAQGKEKSLAQGLKGTAADLDTISTLEEEFAGGIQQNQKNKKDALAGC